MTPKGIENPVGAPYYTTKVIGGEEVVLDDEGFLVNPDDWSEKVAEELATEAGLPQLTEIHWETIRFLRTFYLTNGKAPLNRDIKRETGMNLLEVERLFPGGIRNGARRLAGLPNPKSC